MAKVTPGEPREQQSSYQLYKQPSGGDQIIAVRRKLAMPSDVEHKSSRETKRQRERFGAASKRWASIPGPVKADLREKYGIVITQTAHGLSEPKVLQGAQLFVSQESHRQKYHQEHQEIPLWFCIQSVDRNIRVIDLPLYLYNAGHGIGVPFPGYVLCPGNTLFYPVKEYTDLYAARAAPWPKGWFIQDTLSYLQLKGKPKALLYPALFEDSYGPYCQPTQATEPNWHYQPEERPSILWTIVLHEHDGTGWYNFKPQPMAQFEIRKLGETTWKIHLTPLGFEYPNCFSTRISGGGTVLWEVTIPAPGLFSITPTAQTAIYNWWDDYLIGYEE